MEPGAKLYVVVRADLVPGLQAAQALHAHREFAEHHTAVERAWYRASNTIAILATPDEPALATLLARAANADVRVAGFREPDLGGALTAICLEPGPGARRLCRKLRPALQV